jgi:hypothetical protein
MLNKNKNKASRGNNGSIPFGLVSLLEISRKMLFAASLFRAYNFLLQRT